MQTFPNERRGPPEMIHASTHGDGAEPAPAPSAVVAETQPLTRVVYLDQNHWVRLARSLTGRDDSCARSVIELLSEGVAEHQLVVTLAAANYLELWHRKSWRSRWDVAAVMRDLTGYMSLPPPQQLLRLGLAHTLSGTAPSTVACSFNEE
jgi:hypothetical protein